MATIREILEARNEIALEGPSNLEQLEKIITRKRSEKKDRPPKQKWARTSLTFLYKAMDDCVKGIPLETIAQIVREVGLCTIGVIEYEPRRR